MGAGKGPGAPSHAAPADGSRRVVVRLGPCWADLWALWEGVCREAVCVWGKP